MMKLALALGFALAAVAGLSGADAGGQAHPYPRLDTTVCIRGDGSTYAPHCQGKPLLCECGRDFHVTLPVCARGEAPAPSGVEANKARFAAAAAGKLHAARYNGQRFCVRVRAEPLNNGCWPQCSLPDGYQAPSYW